MAAVPVVDVTMTAVIYVNRPAWRDYNRARGAT